MINLEEEKNLLQSVNYIFNSRVNSLKPYPPPPLYMYKGI